jgi:adenylyl cyclase-associated protein
VLTVEITDPKQQVYMFNCDHVTVQVTGGKLKSVILDKCEYCSVVFDTVISSAEIVHCKKIQIQTTGVCPSFSIDQTDGIVVYLSKESVATTNFVTSQSTEMNVSFPDGDEQKEFQNSLFTKFPMEL